MSNHNSKRREYETDTEKKNGWEFSRFSERYQFTDSGRPKNPIVSNKYSARLIVLKLSRIRRS